MLSPEHDPFWSGPRHAWLCFWVGHKRQMLMDDSHALVYCSRCGTVLETGDVTDERRAEISWRR